MNSAIINFYSQNKVAAAGGVDSDAQAFFTAAGITDATQKSAVDTLVKSLKSNSLWTNMFVIYPFVGSSSSQQSYNLKNPSLYQLSFSGTWSFSSNGAQGNETNTYADVGANLSTLGCTLNSLSFGFYNRKSLSTNQFEAGSFVTENQRVILYSYLNNTAICDLGASGNRLKVDPTPDTKGLWVGTRTSSSVYGLYRNGTAQDSTTSGSNNSTNLPSYSFYFGGLNTGSGTYLTSGNELAFAFIADGLTSTQISTLYTIVQTYETTLGRNV